MNRIRVSGEISYSYEQIIELSDEELKKFRDELKEVATRGEQAVDDFLAADYSDTEPLDVQCDFWDAELIDDKGLVIEDLT